jgi:hypothetical protein
MISSPEAMTVIFSSPLCFPVIQAPPLKVTLTSELSVDAILPHIVAAKPTGDLDQRLVLHMDNASAHRARLTARNLEDNRITASPHPAFSPSLAPSDFFFFGALKGQQIQSNAVISDTAIIY